VQRSERGVAILWRGGDRVTIWAKRRDTELLMKMFIRGNKNLAAKKEKNKRP